MTSWNHRRRIALGVILVSVGACSSQKSGQAATSSPATTAATAAGTVATEGTTAREPTESTIAPADAPEASDESTTSTAPAPLPEIHIDVDRAVGGFAGTQGLSGGLGQEAFVVTSAEDSGDGSYRHALRSGQRYITFDPSLDGESIRLKEPVIATGSDITIDGSGVDITITGSATRFSGTNVVIAGMTYRDFDRSNNEDAVTFLDASQTQLIGLFNNQFASATDGLVDLIWNRGNDVFATICGNRFERHDKAMLIHSGREGREGGRYHVTLCHNEWNDTYQRTPLSRIADIHQYNSVFERYGKPNGDGGGSKAGGDQTGDTQHLLESNVAIPRANGETTFDGSTVSAPRSEWAGPQAQGDGVVDATGTLLVTKDGVTASETLQDPDLVFEPPYEYELVPASLALLDVIGATAGVCVPAEVAAVDPCAPLVFIEADTTITARLDGVTSTVEALLDGVAVASAEDVGDGRWAVDLDGRPGEVATLTMVATTADGRTVSSEPIVVGFVG